MYLDDIAAYVPQDAAEAGNKAMILEYLRLFPNNILTRDNQIAHLTASGFVVNGDGTKVLMAHHNLYRVWAWTGGHVDGEADFLAVALREAREETGVTHIRPLSDAVASLEILPVWGHVKRGRYVPSHLHLNVSYVLLADENDPLSVREGENTRVGWLLANLELMRAGYLPVTVGADQTEEYYQGLKSYYGGKGEAPMIRLVAGLEEKELDRRLKETER